MPDIEIDIAADCGARPEIIRFFRGEEIVLKSGLGRLHGHFSSNSSNHIEIEDTVEPPQRPYVLHELLHAYHFGVLPGRFHNPDVLRFYNRAKTYKLYPAKILKAMKLETSGFETDHEITAKLIRGGLKIVEVPISYHPRSAEEGKKIKPSDGFMAVWTLLKFRFIS